MDQGFYTRTVYFYKGKNVKEAELLDSIFQDLVIRPPWILRFTLNAPLIFLKLPYIGHYLFQYFLLFSILLGTSSINYAFFSSTVTIQIFFIWLVFFEVDIWLARQKWILINSICTALCCQNKLALQFSFTEEGFQVMT